MHLRSTFFLLVLTALILSFICFREISDNSEAVNRRAAARLLELEPERVGYWSFAGANEFLECFNEHGQWTIAKPVKARAKDAKINYMLSVLAALPRGETITADQRKARALTLADYGLEKPVSRIVVGSQEKRIVINIGNLSPLKDSLYVRLNDSDTIVATSTNLLQIIPRDLADIRDNHLIYGSPSYVGRIEIKSGRRPLVLAVREGAEWILRKPILARADWLKMTALLDSLFNAQVERFVSDTMSDPASYGLGDDEAILQVGVWQNEMAEYLVFGRKPNEQGDVVYACLRGQNSVFTVSAEIVRALDVAAVDIRDSRIFFMAPDSIASIRIEEDKNILQLVRAPDTGWQITEPKKWKADDHGVETLISRLNSLRVEMFMAGTNMDARMPEKFTKIISVSDSPPDSAVSNQPAPDLSRQLAGRGPEALTAPPERPLFNETSPKASLAAASRARDEGKGVPEKPSPPAEKITRSLLVSAPVQGQEYVFGRFADEEETYRLSASAAAISINPMSYRDNTVLSFDPASVRKITLRRNGREQAAVRDDAGVWKTAGAPPAPVNQKVVGDLLALASRLRATRLEQSDGLAVALYGLQPASTAITFNFSGEEGISKTVLLGEISEDNGVYAMLQGQEIVFVLDRELVNLLLRDFIR